MLNFESSHSKTPTYYLFNFFSKLSQMFFNMIYYKLLCFSTSLKTEINKVTSVKCLAEMLIVDNAALSSAFSDVVMALMLFLTLLVTVASAERSFSKLKIAKSCLSNSVGQNRLHGLSLSATEAVQAKIMNVEDLTTNLQK
jgi:hAT family C-terminal dimerisation region